MQELIEAAHAVVDEALVTDDADAMKRMHRLRVAVQIADHYQFRKEHEALTGEPQQPRSVDELETSNAQLSHWLGEARECNIRLTRERDHLHKHLMGQPGVELAEDNLRLLAENARMRERLAMEPGEEVRTARDSYERNQQLWRDNTQLTADVAHRDARIKELEDECDLLIWENEQAAKVLWSYQQPVTLNHLTDEQRATLLRQLDGPSKLIAEASQDSTAELRKRLAQALDALHAERKPRRLAEAELERVSIIIGKLRTNAEWVRGVMGGLASGGRMDAAPVIGSSPSTVDMLQLLQHPKDDVFSVELQKDATPLACKRCGHAPAMHMADVGTCDHPDCSCGGYTP